MQVVFALFLFSLGLLFTVKGGDSFVLAATRISELFSIPKFIIGATVVSLATTLPELLVSLFSAVDGKTDMAVGNAVGSVSANTGLILALSVIFLPSALPRRKSAVKCLLLLFAVVSLYIFSLSGRLLFAGTALLLLIFCGFIAENILNARGVADSGASDEGESLSLSLLRFTVGGAGIVIGATLLVDNASLLAAKAGVSEAVISATVLAVGTSLPELATTLCAIRRRESSLSIGNILGANIIDISVILPLCSLLSGKPLPISAQGLRLDMPACLFIICIAVLPALFRGKFTRMQGAFVLAAYILYISLILISS